MSGLSRNILLFLLMLGASGLALALRPGEKVVDQSAIVEFARIIPTQFGDWQEEVQHSAQIVDPQQKQTIDKIYAQTLTRTYVNQSGRRIMLSLAYGTNQSDGVALHLPEVCYPSQGFILLSEQKGVLPTPYDDIRVKRLMTQLRQRHEPVTYWTMLGDHVVQGGLETKLAQLQYSVHGQIPDGLLFRVSSIASDAAVGYAEQQRFVQALLGSLSDADRHRLAGLSGEAR